MPESNAEQLTSAMCAQRAAKVLDQACRAEPEFAHALVDAARAWIDLALQLEQYPSMQPRSASATCGTAKANTMAAFGQRGPE